MKPAESKDSSYYGLFFVLLLGALTGFITYFFFETLNDIGRFYQNQKSYLKYLPVLLFPLVLVILQIIKKKTLYFPRKISDLKDPELGTVLLSPWMSAYHFFGTALSHASGASLGREGAVTLIATGLIHLFRLSWTFWSPIMAGIGFSAATGSAIAGIFFATELLKTNIKQKIFILLGSMVSVNLLATLRHDPLVPVLSQNLEVGFFSKIMICLALAFSAGLMMRLYKKIAENIHLHFENKVYLKFAAAFVVAALLVYEPFAIYKGLGLQQLKEMTVATAHFDFVALKLLFTLLCVALGFWGGEFVPLVISGFVFGQSMGLVLGQSMTLSGYLAAFIFFAAGTRLKWTAIVLSLHVMGFSWIFWVYLTMSLAVSISGSKSLYGKEPEQQWGFRAFKL